VPTSILPEWVAPWRTQLEQQRADLHGYLADRAARRVDTATELAELQPRLAAARAAWQPYADRIAEIDDELRIELRPAMWAANRDATRAGFGHRHSASRRANHANGRVEHAEARIASIHTDGADVKQQLDTLEAEARNLHDLAFPSPAGHGLEQFHREQLNRIEPLLDAVDIWTTWAHGRPVPTADLATAVSTLTDAARRGPLLAVNQSEIDRTQWFDALQPVTDPLRMRGIDLHSDRRLDLERGPELGIDLLLAGHGRPLGTAGTSIGGRFGAPVRRRAAGRIWAAPQSAATSTDRWIPGVAVRAVAPAASPGLARSLVRFATAAQLTRLDLLSVRVRAPLARESSTTTSQVSPTGTWRARALLGPTRIRGQVLAEPIAGSALQCAGARPSDMGGCAGGPDRNIGGYRVLGLPCWTGGT
jgi:hypothetical protein